MWHVSLYVLVLCLTTIHCMAVPAGTLFENKTVTVGDSLFLTSPSFPECCLRNVTFFIHCVWENCGLKIVFIDVSLPESASLTIQDFGTHTAAPLAIGTVTDGVWSRPSIAHEGPDVAISLYIPTSRLYPQYTGIRMHIQAYNTAHKEEPDVTSAAECGRILLPRWQGGEIKVTPGHGNALMDCVWVVTKPVDAPQTASVFVRFTYTFNLMAIMSVRNGSNSYSPTLFYHDVAESGATGLNHGKEGFTSPDSLFVRIKKPVNSGAVTFIYGMFSREVPDLPNEVCRLGSRKGFACLQSGWCVPWTDRCDEIPQCPNHEDEQQCEAFARDSRLSDVITPNPVSLYESTTTITRSKCNRGFKYCPGQGCIESFGPCPGECYSFQKLCKDMSCVEKYSTCPGECEPWEKKCEDQCILSSSRCPGECDFNEKKCEDDTCVKHGRYCESEHCPAYHKNRCGDVCYSDNQKCDGQRQCENGADEFDCSLGFPWYIIFILLGVAAIILLILYSKKRNQQSLASPSHQSEFTRSGVPTSATVSSAPNYPVIAGARSYAPTSNTASNAPTIITAQDAAASAPLTEPESAPLPSYAEAMFYDHSALPATAPPTEAPPPYDSVAATNLPPKPTPDI